MTRLLRALAALLLAAVPLRAQTRRVVAPALLPPAFAPAAAAAIPYLSPALAAPAALPPPAAPPTAILAPEAAPAPAPTPRTSAATLAPAGTAPDAGNAQAPDAAGPKLFDGQAAASQSAAVAVPGTEGLSGAPLLDVVSRIAAAGHRVSTPDGLTPNTSYHAAMLQLFSKADHVVRNGASGVVDAYSGVFIPGVSSDEHDYTESGDPTHDGFSKPQNMNVEHVFPQSWFDRKTPMRADLHHLMATFEHPNGVRGNLPFGVAKGHLVYHNDAGAKSDGLVFEPPDFTKGRVARAMLYFYARYRKESFFTGHTAAFWNPQIEVLLDWNRRFPPKDEEIGRNDLVQAYQGNRNPFIDDPSLADRIGAQSLRAGSPAVPASPSVLSRPPPAAP